MKKALSIVLSLLLILAIFAGCQTQAQPEGGDSQGSSEQTSDGAVTADGSYTPGTYTRTTPGMHAPITVEVTVSDTAITDITVTEHQETPGLGDIPIKQIPAEIVANQSLAVDTVTGATITSAILKNAIKECLEEAGGDMDALNAPLNTPAAEDMELSADVVIVGGGGAGLAAAVSAIENGATVIVIEKNGFVGGNSLVAGGIYNAPDPSQQDYHNEERSPSLETLITEALEEDAVSEEHQELMDVVAAEYEEYLASDKTMYDSINWFALQTWNGGDKVADLNMVKILTANAFPTLEWLKAGGMEFLPGITHGGGSLYPRTHTAVLPNGFGYMQVFETQLDGKDEYTLLLNTTATGLIMDGDKVVGVEAQGEEGNQITLTAEKGVVLATGGFAGNVELRQKYGEGEKWPDLGPSVTTSNMPSVTGDGIFFAEAAGAQLVNMEQIQLLPYCNPDNGGTYDIVTSSGYVFINKEGERFVREDGRRDDMSKAIIAQTDGVMYLFNGQPGIDPSTKEALGGQTLQYYLDTNHAGYVMADTLEEMAELLDVPADVLIKTIEDYNTYVDSGEVDPYGRASYSEKIEAPYFAYPRKPAVHHTMGGVKIDELTRALKEDGTPVPGLYCAGEITGVIHGANRLGGNAIVDFAVFGRIAGESAAAEK